MIAIFIKLKSAIVRETAALKGSLALVFPCMEAHPVWPLEKKASVLCPGLLPLNCLLQVLPVSTLQHNSVFLSLFGWAGNSLLYLWGIQWAVSKAYSKKCQETNNLLFLDILTERESPSIYAEQSLWITFPFGLPNVSSSSSIKRQKSQLSASFTVLFYGAGKTVPADDDMAWYGCPLDMGCIRWLISHGGKCCW